MRTRAQWELLCFVTSLAAMFAGSSCAWPLVPKFDGHKPARLLTENVKVQPFISAVHGRRILRSRENERLRTAAFVGDAEGVSAALADGADVHSVSRSDNATALHWAAANGHVEVVEVLIRAGADLDVSGAVGPNFSGASPLHLAVIFNQLEVVRVLLDAGADVDINLFEFTEGETISGLTPLNAAACLDNMGSVRQLLEGGADLELPDSRGFGPLLTAAEKGFAEVVDALIAAGADVNTNTGRMVGVEAVEFTFNVSSITPLHIATMTGSGSAFVTIVKALTAAGARVDATLQSSDPFVQGITALWLAADNRKSSIARILIDAQASLNAPNAFGATPLLMASVRGHGKLVKILIAAGADVNMATTGIIQFSGTGARHSAGVTPLYAAAMQGEVSISASLVSGGADPNKLTEIGQGPLHIVSATVGDSSQTIATDLLAAGADLATRNVFGWTPLMNAVYYGNIGVVDILLEAGADPSVTSNEGETALDLVCSCLADDERIDYVQCPSDGCELLETSQELVITLSQLPASANPEPSSSPPPTSTPPPPNGTSPSTSDCLVFDMAEERLECLLALQGV